MGRGEVGAFQALEPGPGSRSDVREAGEDTEGARREAQDLEEAQQASRIRETTERNATIRCKLLEDGSAENARNWGRVTARTPGGTALPSTARRENGGDRGSGGTRKGKG